MFLDLMKTITEWQKVAVAATQVTMSAATVIQARVMQMALGVMKPQEFTRMILEKPSAFARSGEMAMRALTAQKGYAVVMAEAIAPIEASTRANARRLAGRPATTQSVPRTLAPKGRRKRR